jgi:hypothetical protein
MAMAALARFVSLRVVVAVVVVPRAPSRAEER